MFSTIDRYVLREVAGSLGGVTAVLLAILVSYQLARILGTAAERGFPHDIVFALIGLTTLENLMLLVPIAMLLGVMLALGRLYHESEMTAVRACGAGPERLYLPVFALALPVAALLGWLAFVVGPAARDGAEQLRGRAMRDAQFGMLEAGKFRTYADGQAVFYAEQLGPGGRLENVFVQRLAGERVEVATAAWAEHRVLDGGSTQLVVLHDGERVEGVPGQPGFRRIRFVEHGIPVVVPAPDAGRTLPERRPTATLLASAELADIAELQRRISMPVMVLVLAIVAVPLAALRPREGRYARVAIAILLYFVYSNLLSAAQVWVEKGQLPAALGTWWVHALMAATGFALLLRQSPASGWGRQTRARA
ncbi:MAG: LPS export ABC transporter permease LptF [Steroidobacteraceae bacterium]|nr:LPS export ABC transporter permease LptF [Steroidobacteraceae bacterium]